MRQKKLVYYGKKCLIFLISVFILSVAVFYVARLAPGDPLISYYGDRTEKMSPEEREWAMGKLGLNEPISVQYVKWVKNAFHGEFGISFKYKQDVVEVIGGRIGNYTCTWRNRIYHYVCRSLAPRNPVCMVRKPAGRPDPV